MFKLLDRYIIWKYLSTFFFVVFLFAVVSVAIDFSDKVDDFLDADVGWFLIAKYYGNFIPYISGMLWPLYALISVIFFTSRMANDSEIISILNAGVSFRRLMRPYLFCAVLLAGIHYVGNHYLLPLANQNRVDFENTYIYKNNYESSSKNIHRFTDTNEKIFIHRFIKRDSSTRNFYIERFEDGKLVYKLKAIRGDYLEEEDKWLLTNYSAREINGQHEKITEGGNIKVKLNISPKDLIRRDNLKETMTTPEIINFISEERERGAGDFQKFEIERDRRSADPFMIFILTLIGLSVAARKVRGGLGIHLLIGAILGGAFIVLSKFSSTFAMGGHVSPLIGAWIPNIIFSMIVLYLVANAQK